MYCTYNIRQFSLHSRLPIICFSFIQASPSIRVGKSVIDADNLVDKVGKYVIYRGCKMFRPWRR